MNVVLTVAVAVAAATVTAAAHRISVKTRGGGFAFAVGVRTVVRLAEIVVRFVAARRTPRTVQAIIAIVVIQLVYAEERRVLISITTCGFSNAFLTLF